MKYKNSTLNSEVIILPEPKEVFFNSNNFIKLSTLKYGKLKDKRIEKALQSLCFASADPKDRCEIAFLTDKKLTAQSYEIHIQKGKIGKITIKSADSAGAFYAIQTLKQLLHNNNSKIPCGIIKDSPDYPVRGFYHDVTRGKVPKLETLKNLIDKMAFYKLNQLQLYIEHTFEYMNHPDIWAGSDPLSHQDILELDKYCDERFIELVPSFSTFGHFYTAICCPRKAHLNELQIDASQKPFSFWDRMQHYTLDCLNPESLRLIEEIIMETSPLFSSKYYNICCDETFDLGRGKNAQKANECGKIRLYVDFLKKIMKVVERAGKIPMFWGDIILKAPQMLGELPREVIALNWDYSPDSSRRECKPFSDSGVKYYVCSGVHGWNRFLNNIEAASSNIISFAKKGLQYGAIGFLNTDWGDFGHINSLGASFHGLILGASASWNLKASENQQKFDKNFSVIEFGEKTPQIADVLRKISKIEKANWNPFVWWTSPSDDMKNWRRDPKSKFFIDEFKKFKNNELEQNISQLENLSQELSSSLEKSSPTDPFVADELLTGLQGSIILHKAYLGLKNAIEKNHKISLRDKKFLFDVADNIRRFELRFSQIWYTRNRPSEYSRIRMILCEIANRLDKIALGKRIN